LFSVKCPIHDAILQTNDKQHDHFVSQEIETSKLTLHIGTNFKVLQNRIGTSAQNSMVLTKPKETMVFTLMILLCFTS